MMAVVVKRAKKKRVDGQLKQPAKPSEKQAVTQARRLGAERQPAVELSLQELEARAEALEKQDAGAAGEVSGSEGGFALELVAALTPLQAALQRMLEEWGSPTFGELCRLSGAGKTLCWQVMRVAEGKELAKEARHAPTPGALKRLLQAARRDGVSDETIAQVESAAEAFRRFSKGHAADRASFESLVAGAAAEESGGEKILLSHRRASYRAASHLYGLQTDLNVSLTMLKRPEQGDGADVVHVRAQLGMRRLRPDAHLWLSAQHLNPSGRGRQTMEALDDEGEQAAGAQAIPQFCSQPLPEVEQTQFASGWLWSRAVGTSVGMRSNLDWVHGSLARNSPFQLDGQRQVFHVTMSHRRKPIERTVTDVLVHRASYGRVNPEVLAYLPTAEDFSMESSRKAQQLPVGGQVVLLGQADRAEMREYPRYGELVRFMAQKTGWDLAEFDVYRLRMEYPILGSVVRVFFYVD